MDELECWTVSLFLCREAGVVRLTVLKYRLCNSSPRWLLLSEVRLFLLSLCPYCSLICEAPLTRYCHQVASVFGVSMTSARAAMVNWSIDSFLEERAPVLQRLKAIGAVGVHAHAVTLLTVARAVLLVDGLGIEPAVLPRLRRLRSSEPPPARHQPGSGR